MNHDYDAILIGGGPSGATAAAILAEYGHRVLVLERDKFPRYRVGESLIPFTFGPLERIGMIPKMRASHFVKKYSVCFVQPDGKRSQPFYFFNRYDRSTGRTYEVRARITLDCSGKEAFAPNKLGWRIPDPQLNKIAVWTYYRGSKREPGIDEGQTTVAMIPEKGWFWHIPQHGDMVSVGVVAEGKYLTRGGVKEPREIFHREVEENLWIKDHLGTGECTGEYFITSEYTRYSRHCASPGLLLLGDAFAFLDPVFSSGVLLALKCGHLAGESVHEGIVSGDLSPTHFAPYGAAIRESVENMRKLVYAFYNPKFSFRDVVQRHPGAADQITDCLSGDVGKDYSQLWDWIREFVPLPDSLSYGEPLGS